jgi:hypothetical protein
MLSRELAYQPLPCCGSRVEKINFFPHHSLFTLLWLTFIIARTDCKFYKLLNILWMENCCQHITEESVKICNNKNYYYRIKQIPCSLYKLVLRIPVLITLFSFYVKYLLTFCSILNTLGRKCMDQHKLRHCSKTLVMYYIRLFPPESVMCLVSSHKTMRSF